MSDEQRPAHHDRRRHPGAERRVLAHRRPDRARSLLHDHYLVQKMQHFNRERVPERVVHAKGAARTASSRSPRTSRSSRRPTSSSRQADADVRALLDRGRRAGLRRHRARPARLRAEVLHRAGQLRPGRQQHAGLLRPRPARSSRTSSTRRSACPTPACARPRHAVGLLDAVARVRAPGDDPDVRPRHPARLSPHARLRQPHVHVDQRRRREVLGQVPLQDRPGHRELHRRRGRRMAAEDPDFHRRDLLERDRATATRPSGASRSRSCRSTRPPTTASTRST